MKRLVLIQNDFTGAGKTTLALSLHHYLLSYRIPHHHVLLAESGTESHDREVIEPDDLNLPTFISHLDQSDLVIMEVDSGMADVFYKFYERKELFNLLPELGYDVLVTVPVTGEDESFDAVSLAAEVFSDAAQYLIVHTPTSSSYDDCVSTWEHSHAARVMDMFEAVDMVMPTASISLEFELKVRHMELPDAITNSQDDAVLHASISEWFQKLAGQFYTAKQYLFGDSFRQDMIPAPPSSKATKSRRKGKTPSLAA